MFSYKKYYVPLSLRSSKQYIKQQVKNSKISYLIKYDKNKIKLEALKKDQNLKIQVTKKLPIYIHFWKYWPEKGACISYKAFNAYITL